MERTLEATIDSYAPMKGKRRRRLEKALAAARGQRTVTILIDELDLEGLKRVARNRGVPCRTLISNAVHEYLPGRRADRGYARGQKRGEAGARGTGERGPSVEGAQKARGTSVKAMEYGTYLEEQLERPGLREEYESLEVDYAIARQVIEYRVNRNLEQGQLAKLAGVAKSTIARMESGNARNLSLGLLLRVAGVLGVLPEISFRPIGGRRPPRTGSAPGSTRGTGRQSARRKKHGGSR